MGLKRHQEIKSLLVVSGKTVKTPPLRCPFDRPDPPRERARARPRRSTDNSAHRRDPDLVEVTRPDPPRRRLSESLAHGTGESDTVTESGLRGNGSCRSSFAEAGTSGPSCVNDSVYLLTYMVPGRFKYTHAPARRLAAAVCAYTLRDHRGS